MGSASSKPKEGENFGVASTDVLENKEKAIAIPEAKKYDYEGVVIHRRTTDIIFLILGLLNFALYTYVGWDAILKGKPARLLNPVNDIGQVCGYDAPVKDNSKFYSVISYGVGVCVYSCPERDASFTSKNASDYYCLQSVIDRTGGNVKVLSGYISSYCFKGGKFDMASDCGCMLKLTSTSLFSRCQLDNPTYGNIFKTQKIKNFVINFIGVFYAAKEIVFGMGIVASFLMGLFWIYMLQWRCTTTIFVFGCIDALIALLGALCYFAWMTASRWKAQTPQGHESFEILGLRATALALGGLSVLTLLLTCSHRTAIHTSIKIISVTAGAIEDMPVLLLTPLMQTSAFVAYLASFVVYAFYTATIGTFLTDSISTTSGVVVTFTVFTLNQNQINRLWYLFFTYIWCTNWLVAMSTISLSIAFSRWYFAPAEQRRSLPYITGSYSAAVRYHMGTAAFGSLIVSLFETFRYFVLYLESKVAGIGRFVFCCINCCMWCVEQILRFITKNAYIQTAIHGKSFCPACVDACLLIIRHASTVGALHMLSRVLMLVGKVFISASCAGGAYYIFNNYYDDKLKGFGGPILMVLILSWTVASMFAEVIDAGVDSILQCYYTDCDQNDGTAKFADYWVQDVVDTHAASHAEKQDSTKAASQA